MKKLFSLPEVQINALQHAANVLNPLAPPLIIEHYLDLFIPDEELRDRLNLSRKTVYNHRRDGYLSYIPFPGKHYTFLPYLINDLLILNRKNPMKAPPGEM